MGTAADQNEGEQVVSKTALKTIRPTAMPQSSPVTAAAGNNRSNSGASNVSFSLGGSVSGASSAAGGLSHTAPSTRKLEAFVENDDEEMEDFEDLIGDDGDLEVKIGAPAAAAAAGGLHSSAAPAGGAHKNNKSIGGDKPAGADIDNIDDEVDPFDDITFEEGGQQRDRRMSSGRGRRNRLPRGDQELACCPL